jgi:hypothetical protein
MRGNGTVRKAAQDFGVYVLVHDRAQRGQIGGKCRLKTMSKAVRSKVAAKAAKARWKKAKKSP